MEQKDYLLREIEKIGLILRAIRIALTGGSENMAVRAEKHNSNAKNMLRDQLNFDIEAFMVMNASDSACYMNQFKGFDTNNIDMLADVIVGMATTTTGDESLKYYEKALFLLEYSNDKSKTFSMERENMISTLKFHLS
ncbi:MAG TPA: hypothetical protein PLM49_07775 [Bacteroidales bacterium]|nr:hypothetical protein [Bacteroidales bacterium]